MRRALWMCWGSALAYFLSWVGGLPAIAELLPATEISWQLLAMMTFSVLGLGLFLSGSAALPLRGTWWRALRGGALVYGPANIFVTGWFMLDGGPNIGIGALYLLFSNCHIVFAVVIFTILFDNKDKLRQEIEISEGA